MCVCQLQIVPYLVYRSERCMIVDADVKGRMKVTIHELGMRGFDQMQGNGVSMCRGTKNANGPARVLAPVLCAVRSVLYYCIVTCETSSRDISKNVYISLPLSLWKPRGVGKWNPEFGRATRTRPRRHIRGTSPLGHRARIPVLISRRTPRLRPATERFSMHDIPRDALMLSLSQKVPPRPAGARHHVWAICAPLSRSPV